MLCQRRGSLSQNRRRSRGNARSRSRVQPPVDSGARGPHSSQRRADQGRHQRNHCLTFLHFHLIAESMKEKRKVPCGGRKTREPQHSATLLLEKGPPVTSSSSFVEIGKIPPWPLLAVIWQEGRKEKFTCYMLLKFLVYYLSMLF